MRKFLAVGVGLVVLSGTGAFAWWKLRPAPPPPPPAAEKSYDQIHRDEMAQWMEDLGYTDSSKADAPGSGSATADAKPASGATAPH